MGLDRVVLGFDLRVHDLLVLLQHAEFTSELALHDTVDASVDDVIVADVHAHAHTACGLQLQVLGVSLRSMRAINARIVTGIFIRRPLLMCVSALICI